MSPGTTDDEQQQQQDLLREPLLSATTGDPSCSQQQQPSSSPTATTTTDPLAATTTTTTTTMEHNAIIMTTTTTMTDNNNSHPHEEEEEEVGVTTTRPISRNIPLMLWYMLIRAGGEAVWLYSVLSAYVYLLYPNKPEILGYLAAIEGIVQFLAALFAGIVADIYRRDCILKIASIIGITASILIIISVTNNNNNNNNTGEDHHHHSSYFWCLVVGLAFNGAFDGFGLTASLALFADSICEGERSYYFTQRKLRTTIGNIFGPVCGLIMFAYLGNEWTIMDCSRVIVSAQVVLIPAFTLLCFFRDENVNADEHDAAHSLASAEYINQEQAAEAGQVVPPRSDALGGNPVSADQDKEPLIVAAANGDHPQASSIGDDHDHEVEASLGTRRMTRRQDLVDNNDAVEMNSDPISYHCGMSLPRYIALCAASSDVICAFASGMSFRYFAIFFLDKLKLGPVIVQGMDAISCLISGGLVLGAQRLSIRFGRSVVSVALKSTGVVLLLLMIFLYLENSTSSTWLVCITYLLQNAFLNCTSALTRSLVMDNVPSNERAKWSALESINIFGWCGSAAVGGILVAKFNGNVIPVFFITACIQFVGSLPLITLFRIEKMENL